MARLSPSKPGRMAIPWDSAAAQTPIFEIRLSDGS
jgi:hypothetical protein